MPVELKSITVVIVEPERQRVLYNTKRSFDSYFTKPE